MDDKYKPNGIGLSRILRAGACSWKGFRYIWKNEAAFKQELLLCVFCVPLGFVLGSGGMERALLIGSVLTIVLVELLNTSIECAIDRIGPEHHPLSGSAKDLGSAAVSLSIVIAAVVWGLVLWP